MSKRTDAAESTATEAADTTELRLRAAGAEDMRALGERLGALMRVGDVVGLEGALGSGKTTFAQGIAAGLGVHPDRHVASPTFALVNEHPGRVPFVHADLYRIQHPAELDELGLAEAYDRAAAALEWIDRFPEVAPADHLIVRISIEPDGGRLLVAHPRGRRSADLASAWTQGVRGARAGRQ